MFFMCLYTLVFRFVCLFIFLCVCACVGLCSLVLALVFGAVVAGSPPWHQFAFLDPNCFLKHFQTLGPWWNTEMCTNAWYLIH